MAFSPPPGLNAFSDPETATCSRERRRVALVCKELSTSLQSRFDALDLQMSALQTQVGMIAQALTSVQVPPTCSSPMLAWCYWRPSGSPPEYQMMPTEQPQCQTFDISAGDEMSSESQAKFEAHLQTMTELVNALACLGQTFDKRNDEIEVGACCGQIVRNLPETRGDDAGLSGSRDVDTQTAGVQMVGTAVQVQVTTADAALQVSEMVMVESGTQTQSASTCLAVQTEAVYFRDRSLQDNDDEHQLATAEGVWEKLLDNDSLQVGDFVKLAGPTKSANPEVVLPEHSGGRVRQVDTDGDPLVFFPKAPQWHEGEHWIERAKVGILRLQTDAEQKDGFDREVQLATPSTMNPVSKRQAKKNRDRKRQT